MSRSLFWFRSDLRLHDNRALAAAAGEGEMLALYIATPAQWEVHDEALIKRDYWRRNLAQLELDLAALGISLLYAEVPDYQAVPQLLASLLPALEVGCVHCNREYPLNERRRDSAVATLCESLGLGFKVHDDQVLTPPAAILTQSGTPFKVFTPFSRRARDYLQQQPPLVAARLKPQLPLGLPPHPALCALDKLSWPDPEPQWAQRWPAGEAYAHQALADFCNDRLAAYHERRDQAAVNGTSQLSPMLAAGVLSVRECWRRSVDWSEERGTLAWQNELLWRDFYKHVMWHFPHVCRHQAWRGDVGHVPWRHDAAEFQRWCDGTTGIPIVDAAMVQLLQTGWMHNRLRMISAMFLTKHLLIDWRWGERFFMRHLIDGDFAANNGGWQWSASTGTDAAPYFRIFNPVTQSRRFDAEGNFLRTYLPQLAALDARTIHNPGLFRPDSYPAPMVDLGFGRERALNAFRV